jgi:hypothetical protein
MAKSAFNCLIVAGSMRFYPLIQMVELIVVGSLKRCNKSTGHSYQ